jgi:hypothetical protein
MHKVSRKSGLLDVDHILNVVLYLHPIFDDILYKDSYGREKSGEVSVVHQVCHENKALGTGGTQ